MSYTHTLTYRDSEFTFEYKCDGEQLVLTGYELNGEDYDLECPVEVRFFVDKAHDWLDDEWRHNGENYIDDLKDR